MSECVCVCVCVSKCVCVHVCVREYLYKSVCVKVCSNNGRSRKMYTEFHTSLSEHNKIVLFLIIIFLI